MPTSKSGSRLRAGTAAAVGFARELADGEDDRVTCLVLGDSVDAVADDASTLAPADGGVGSDHPSADFIGSGNSCDASV